MKTEYRFIISRETDKVSFFTAQARARNVDQALAILLRRGDAQEGDMVSLMADPIEEFCIADGQPVALERTVR